jgi:hypothetical protein
MVAAVAMAATAPPVVRAVKAGQVKVSSVAREMAATVAVQESRAMAAAEARAVAMAATVAIPERQAPVDEQALLAEQG